MSGREFKDWVAAYLKYTENSESPRSYHTWGAISCIAAALQRKVVMRWGYDEIYPNHFIVLVGPSGAARKGQPIMLARRMVKSMGWTVLGDDNSPEAIARDMAASSITYKDGHDVIKYQCPVNCIVEELAVFTGYQNGRFLAYLTAWYDSRDDWKRNMKTAGVDDIVGVYFNAFTATAPDWLPQILPKEAVGGGFTSRAIFIVEDRKHQIVADPNKNMPSPELWTDLQSDLEKISLLSGEARFDRKARDIYVNWYEENERNVQRGVVAELDPALRGYHSRKQIHAMKVAIALSAARRSDLLITEAEINQAIELLTLAEAKMSRVFTGVGKAKYAEELEKILDLLKERKSITKSTLMRMFYRNLDDLAMESIANSLHMMGVVGIKRNPETGETTFTYTGP